MTLGSPLLSAVPGLRHAFFTRDGGVSGGIYAGLNGGVGSNDDPADVAENRRRMAAQMGVTPAHFLSVYQIHSPDAVVATGPWQGGSRPRADAIVTRTEGLAIGVTAADCGPILFVDPKARVIGVAHAGWKGALTGILESTVAAMEELGAERAGIVAAIGPLIRQPSYEVGDEFVERFMQADADNALFFIPAARRSFDVRSCGFHPDAARKRRRVDDRRHRPRHLFRRALLQLSPFGASPRAGLRPPCPCHRAGAGLVSKRPPPSAPSRPSASDQALERAVLALRMQRPFEAERLAADVLKSNRGNALAAEVLGRALLMQNRVDEAIVALERAVRRSDDPAIETLLAAALAEAGRSGEALEQLQRTTARRPAYPPAFLEQGSQLAKSGRLDDAIAVLENGLALAPDARELRLELGFLHLKANSRGKARALFLQVLAAAPERPEVLAALAKVMALDGEYAAAADVFRRVLGLRPDDVMTRNSLAVCQLEMGEREAGEASLRAVARDAPHLAGQAITSLAASSHGRFFLRPSAVAKFLQVKKP